MNGCSPALSTEYGRIGCDLIDEAVLCRDCDTYGTQRREHRTHIRKDPAPGLWQASLSLSSQPAWVWSHILGLLFAIKVFTTSSWMARDISEDNKSVIGVAHTTFTHEETRRRHDVSEIICL